MLKFVTGNTQPFLNGTITGLNETTNEYEPINLGGCTVRMQMRKDDDRRFTVNQEVTTVVNAAAGQVQYEWGPNDLNTPGIYLVQFEVTYPDATVQTTAEPPTIEVRRA